MLVLSNTAFMISFSLDKLIATYDISIYLNNMYIIQLAKLNSFKSC